MGYYQGDYYHGDYYQGSPLSLLIGAGAKIGGKLLPLAKKGAQVVAKKAVGIFKKTPSVVKKAGGVAVTVGAGGIVLGGGGEKKSADEIKTQERMGLKGAGPGQLVGGRRRHRMNVTNPKALRRAIRRARGFAKLARKVLTFPISKPPKGRALFKKR